MPSTLIKAAIFKVTQTPPQNLSYIWAEINASCFQNIYLGLDYPNKPTLLSKREVLLVSENYGSIMQNVETKGCVLMFLYNH